MSTSQHPPQLSLCQLAAVESSFAAIAIGIGLFRHDLKAFSLELRAAGAVAALVVSAALGWLLGTTLLLSRLRPAIIRAGQPFQALTSATLSILVASGLAAVGEELLFRAALQPWLGIWAASLGFALVHSGTARVREGLSIGKLSYVIGTLLAALVLGHLYRSAGLLTTMIAHAGFDAALLMALAPELARSSVGGAA
jgi:membrane protease YdiL (CAAX protease family)